MKQRLIEELCAAADTDTLIYSPHYRQRARRRPSPQERDIIYILCADAPEIIEERTEDSVCLIWGTATDGRISHVLCEYYPGYRVVTAYFPSETEPYKWEDSEYRIRSRAVE